MIESLEYFEKDLWIKSWFFYANRVDKQVGKDGNWINEYSANLANNCVDSFRKKFKDKGE